MDHDDMLIARGDKTQELEVTQEGWLGIAGLAIASLAILRDQWHDQSSRRRDEALRAETEEHERRAVLREEREERIRSVVQQYCDKRIHTGAAASLFTLFDSGALLLNGDGELREVIRRVSALSPPSPIAGMEAEFERKNLLAAMRDVSEKKKPRNVSSIRASLAEQSGEPLPVSEVSMEPPHRMRRRSAWMDGFRRPGSWVHGWKDWP